MFKIKYYNKTSNFEGTHKFNSPEEADSYLRINDFKFNRNKKAYEKKQGDKYQEAVIVEY